ncbi:hypothetical protein [Mosquito VEM Anellovirus SDRB B]|nr:hypothetical protein [Mosquito VEM Anellovirus SDRB B]
MAYYWRRRYPRYTRRRTTNRRYTRRRRYARRTYGRRRVSWRRLVRRHARRRRFNVTQYQPYYRKKCRITALLPLLFCKDGRNGIVDFMMPTTSLVNNWMGGGVDSGTCSLLDLYWEEKFWRARWSASNQGFDLGRYYGVTITLWPSQHYSYIFWWSTEELAEDKEPLTVCHPSQLLLAKQHVIVQSYARTGRPKPIRIRIKPPTSMIGAWWHITDFAKKPLLKWRTSLIDLETPWTVFPNNNTYCIPINVWAWEPTVSDAREYGIFYHPMLDDGTQLKVCIHEIKWNNTGDGPDIESHGFWPNIVLFANLLVPFYIYCFGRGAEYYSNNKDIHRPQPENRQNGWFIFIYYGNSIAFRQQNGALLNFRDKMFYIKYNTMQIVAAGGPWVEKQIGVPANVAVKMKFYFQWGGTPGTQLPPVAPAEGGHVWPLSTTRWPGALRADIRDPTISATEVLKKEDLDSDGIATERAIARITKPHFSTEDTFQPQRQKIWGSVQYPPSSRKRKREHRYYSSEEEETPHDSSTQEDTEGEASAAEEAEERHLERKRKYRKLLRLVERLGILQPSSTSHSGRQKSHSV